MAERSSSTVSFPGVFSKDVLSDVLRQGAQRMLAQAIEAEVAEWIDGHAEVTDGQGRRQVVRNG
jgi:putative transposase